MAEGIFDLLDSVHRGMAEVGRSMMIGKYMKGEERRPSIDYGLIKIGGQAQRLYRPVSLRSFDFPSQ